MGGRASAAIAPAGAPIEGPWVPTVRGRPFPLLAPKADLVDIRDMAEQLAKVNRFTGATQTFYSVAQHSVHVARLLPPHLQPYGLLHDGHEAYMGDITTPVKEALKSLGAGDAIERLKRILDVAIFQAFGLPWPLPPHDEIAIKKADEVALATETRDLLAEGPIYLAAKVPGDNRMIDALPWHRAADHFLEAFRDIFPTHAVQPKRLPL